MTLHQFDENMRPDSDFNYGDLSHLVEGNTCRLLDGRRTPGYIEKVFMDSAMFRWKISKFEDEGKYWDVPMEYIDDYQFDKDVERLNTTSVEKIEKLIKSFDKPLEIMADDAAKKETEEQIKTAQAQIEKWLKENSVFLESDQKLDMDSNKGSQLLAQDLQKYMASIGFAEAEKLTSEMIVLNPNSGEWIKGLTIVLAEMGIVSYYGKITRTPDVFAGMGSKDKRKEYIVHRLAFIRAIFAILDMNELPVYRGMSSEANWKGTKRTFISFTFNQEVGQSYADFSKNSRAKNSYLIKATMPIESFFMTYLETESMNERYLEAEALIFNTGEIVL